MLVSPTLSPTSSTANLMHNVPTRTSANTTQATIAPTKDQQSTRSSSNGPGTRLTPTTSPGTSPVNSIRPLPSPNKSSRSISPLPPPVTTTTNYKPHQHHSGQPKMGSGQHSHSYSNSTSGTSSGISRATSPRISTAHMNGTGSSHHNNHPSFVNQHLPAFSQSGQLVHGYANPQYPFIPSPHPITTALGYQPGPYSPSFTSQPGAPGYGLQHHQTQAATPTVGGSASASAESLQQHQARLMQEAHRQQYQWQMEMLRQQQQQQQQQEWQDPHRRRATSGPASASPSPQSFTTPLPYPPSPSPTQLLKQLPNVSSANAPSLPAGAMIPHGMHGYPTPPGSTEGRDSGGSNGSRDGYHPYRRGHGGKSSGDTSSDSHHTGARASSHPRHPTSSHTPTGSSSSSASQQSRFQQQQHARQDSSASTTSALAGHHQHTASLSAPSRTDNMSNKPSPTASSTSSLHTTNGSSTRHHPNSSVTSVASTSARSSPPLPPHQGSSHPSLRDRTDSQQSLKSVDSGRASFESSHGAAAGSSQSQVHHKKPSPLSRQYDRSPGVSSSRSSGEVERPGTPGTLRVGRNGAGGSGFGAGLHDGTAEDEDSDDTAGATIAPNSARAAQALVAPAPSASKEKSASGGGMKSRWKKAFGGGGGSSTTMTANSALTEAEVEGRGPRRLRANSASSGESGPVSFATTTASAHHRDMSSVSSTTLGSTSRSKPPPAPSSSKRSLFNGKFGNASTDNVSISSTVSSASVMIRKLGQMGKMARRNSLMSLTKAFKKDSTKDRDDSKSLNELQLAGSGSTSQGNLTAQDGKKKKSTAAVANVSHVTAEIESQRYEGMSPAAALAKKHQQQYAEQEAAAAAAAEALERERALQRQQQEQQQQQQQREMSKSSNRMLEKEKEKLKKQAAGGGRKWGFGSKKSKSDLSAGAGGDSASFYDGASVFDDAKSISAQSYYTNAPEGGRSGVEVLAQPSAAYAAYGASYRDGSDSRSFVGGSEYEPSVVEPVPSQRRDVHSRPVPVRGILKGASSYRQDDYALPRPNFPRVRASSFDAPLQQRDGQSSMGPGPSAGAGNNVALVDTIPSDAQIDGLVPAATAPRGDLHQSPDRPSSAQSTTSAAPPNRGPLVSSPASSIHNNSTGPYANPALNNSAPALSHFHHGKMGQHGGHHPSRSASAPGGPGRRITFAQILSVHTTWPAAVYDRRAEPATCNRLTPTLAQQIKEELNSYKMEEMDVHPASRQLTHFFV